MVFRIDTTKHVDMGFWQSWCPAVHAFAASNGLPNFFMFGEVYDTSEALCGSYTGTRGGGLFLMDSVLDYPLYFTINSVFATARGNTRQIVDHYGRVDAHYDANAQMRLVTFLDNHDQPRFLSPAKREQQHQPPRRRAGFSLHLARYSVFILRHRAGLQRQDRSLRP